MSTTTPASRKAPGGSALPAPSQKAGSHREAKDPVFSFPPAGFSKGKLYHLLEIWLGFPQGGLFTFPPVDVLFVCFFVGPAEAKGRRRNWLHKDLLDF